MNIRWTTDSTGCWCIKTKLSWMVCKLECSQSSLWMGATNITSLLGGVSPCYSSSWAIFYIFFPPPLRSSFREEWKFDTLVDLMDTVYMHMSIIFCNSFLHAVTLKKKMVDRGYSTAVVISLSSPSSSPPVLLFFYSFTSFLNPSLIVFSLPKWMNKSRKKYTTDLQWACFDIWFVTASLIVKLQLLR